MQGGRQPRRKILSGCSRQVRYHYPLPTITLCRLITISGSNLIISKSGKGAEAVQMSWAYIQNLIILINLSFMTSCDGTPGCVMFTVFRDKCYLKRFVAAPVSRVPIDGRPFTLYAKNCGTSGKICCFGTSCEGTLVCASGTCVDTNANVAVQSSCGLKGEKCCGAFGDCDEGMVCDNFLEKNMTNTCNVPG